MLEIIKDYEAFRQNQDRYSDDEKKKLRDHFRQRIDANMEDPICV